MPNQITRTNTRNYDPSEMLGFKHSTNDLGPYFLNAILGPSGIGLPAGSSAFGIGNAAGFTLLAVTSTTVTNPGLTISTGNTGETTIVGGGNITFGTGSDTGTTAPYAAANSDTAALWARLKALPGIDISTNASALDAYNAGQGLGVFVPGVYTTPSGITVTASKTITLSGAGDYVFVSTGGGITFGSTDVILLTNGATAGRVFWVANNAITTGSTNTAVGNFLSGPASAITIGSTNILTGRLLSQATIVINGTASTFALPTSGAGSGTASNSNTLEVRTQDTWGTPVVPGNLAALTTALLPDGLTLAGNLAIGFSRVYTFLAQVNVLTGAVTQTVVSGFDFVNTRPVNVITDVNLGDGARAIVGYLLVNNGSTAVFVPGTTFLNTTGLTSIFIDGFGYMSYNAVA